VERRRRLAYLLAVPAGELLADVLDHLPLPRDHLQRLGDILAQLAQALAAAAQAGDRRRLDDPLARQMLGKGFARRPLARERRGRRLGGGPLGGEFVLGGRSLKLLELQLQLIQKLGGALRARAEAIPVELLDLQLEMGDQGLVIGPLSPDGGDLGARRDQRRLQRFDVVRQGFEGGAHALMESQNQRFVASLSVLRAIFFAAYPALSGRQVCCGFRQSIASRR
jgi:hypothetical protein